MQRALITGITGQDGSYLAELLLQKGYTVIGTVRRTSSPSLPRIAHLVETGQITLIQADLTDPASLKNVLTIALPDEIYNLAAMSHVGTSFDMPFYTTDVNAVGVYHLLDATIKIVPRARFYQASTSELYGKVLSSPQSETTPFYPRSPYGIAKLYAYWMVVHYREKYNLYACNGILFNHESPRRGEEFVSRKITLAAAKIALGKQDKLLLGNLHAKRDWGYAKEFVEGMWLMLQQKEPEDFVLATGQTHTVKQFTELAFAAVGIDLLWKGTGAAEKGIDKQTGKVLIEVNPTLFRPTEVDLLCGDPSKAAQKLGWHPRCCLQELVDTMVQNDYKEQYAKNAMH